MMKPIVLKLAVVLVAGSAALAQSRFNVQEQDTIRRTLAFSPAAGTKTLEIDNVTGGPEIQFDGFNGDVRILTAR
jgi:hypothetical protein